MFWDDILHAVNDLQFGFLIAMVAGYGFYRLLRHKKAEDDSRGDASDSGNDDNVKHNGSDEAKLVLIVRMDLKMGKGKIAAQCAHGAVAAYKSAMKHAKILRAWEREGQKKIALKVEDEISLKELAKHARAVGLLTNVIHDAGRTQIAAGSQTVCAIGPGPSTLIDRVTGHLKLL